MSKRLKTAMNKRPAIHDVAQRAAVSKTTVSHVINGTRFVSEPTRQRVLQAISELAYRPSTAARSLTTNRTGTIGMLISDAANHFFGEILRGIEEVLRPENYGLIVCNTDETLEREAHYLDLIMRQRVEGIIAAAISRHWGTQLATADAQYTPIVFVDRYFEGLSGPYVGVNNREGAYLGASHLVAAGHREIGIVAGFQRLSTMRERLDGFLAALRDHDIPVREEWVRPCPLTIEDGRRTALAMLSPSQRPTALFLNNNLLSLGALLALADLNMGCPEEVSLVGFDDHPWAAVAQPPLTVVYQPSRRLGQVAAEMLLTLLQGRELSERRVFLECHLVTRRSVGPPPN